MEEHESIVPPAHTHDGFFKSVFSQPEHATAFFKSHHTLSTNPELEKNIMSVAEKLKAQGRQEGRQEGRQDAIISNLRMRLGPVPEGLVEAIHQVTDPSGLEALQHASLTCCSIEEFAASL